MVSPLYKDGPLHWHILGIFDFPAVRFNPSVTERSFVIAQFLARSIHILPECGFRSLLGFLTLDAIKRTDVVCHGRVSHRIFFTRMSCIASACQTCVNRS
jgi:hypothetical protein